MARPLPTRFADAPALSRRARGGIVVAIFAAHLLLVLALVRACGGVQALAGAARLGPVLSATVIAIPPTAAAHGHQDQGVTGTAGKRALADQIVALAALVPAPSAIAAPVAGIGSETRSGASAGGEGTGGGASGAGIGNGGTGHGSGAGVSKAVKIAGDLAEADYAKAGRAERLGSAVIVALTVGIDGRVSACRVHQPSGDADADTVTCRLASERFRFRPALDQHGDPVESVFGWQQRFFWK